jgi:hypothetical protein
MEFVRYAPLPSSILMLMLDNLWTMVRIVQFYNSGVVEFSYCEKYLSMGVSKLRHHETRDASRRYNSMARILFPSCPIFICYDISHIQIEPISWPWNKRKRHITPRYHHRNPDYSLNPIYAAWVDPTRLGVSLFLNLVNRVR